MPYWSLPLGTTARPPSEAEAALRVRELLTQAVRRRLVADVSLGVFLSGGLDSSIIVGIMSGLVQEPVRTFSIGFTGDPRFDETAYARLVSRRFGTQHTEFIAEPSSVGLIERLVWHHDGPFADSSAIPTYLLSRMTRQHVTVALNGDGGDELFAGYLRFYAAVASERVPQRIRQAIWRLTRTLPNRAGHGTLASRFTKWAGSASLPFIERYSRWISVFYDDLPILLDSTDPGFEAISAARHDPAVPLAAFDPHVRRSAQASRLTQLLYLNMKTYLLDDLLVKMDRCSMAHGLEARSPFLDRELMEYVFQLPDDMKLRWGRTKVVLRRAFADLLPAAIQRRRKMGFGVPLRAWFTSDLQDYVRDLLLAPGARLRAHVNHAYVRRLVEAHLAGEADYSHRLWTLLTFEVWLRDVSLGAGAPPPPSASAAWARTPLGAAR